MPDFLTRHSEGFSLTNGRIECGLSPYVESFPNYAQKSASLAGIVGTSQFLWAVEASKGFKHVESDKPVEWLVRVPDDGIIGYIDNAKWMEVLAERSADVNCCFSKSRPASGSFSVLLRYPLRREEVISQRLLRGPHEDG
jgi:hypothetical protein